MIFLPTVSHSQDYALGEGYRDRIKKMLDTQNHVQHCDIFVFDRICSMGEAQIN